MDKNKKDSHELKRLAKAHESKTLDDVFQYGEAKKNEATKKTATDIAERNARIAKLYERTFIDERDLGAATTNFNKALARNEAYIRENYADDSPAMAAMRQAPYASLVNTERLRTSLALFGALMEYSMQCNYRGIGKSALQDFVNCENPDELERTIGKATKIYLNHLVNNDNDLFRFALVCAKILPEANKLLAAPNQTQGRDDQQKAVFGALVCNAQYKLYNALAPFQFSRNPSVRRTAKRVESLVPPMLGGAAARAFNDPAIRKNIELYNDAKFTIAEERLALSPPDTHIVSNELLENLGLGRDTLVAKSKAKEKVDNENLNTEINNDEILIDISKPQSQKYPTPQLSLLSNRLKERIRDMQPMRKSEIARSM